MERASGNIFIRTNYLADKPNNRVHGHKHNFDHTTYIQKGWVLIVAKLEDGSVVEQQFASAEHAYVRELEWMRDDEETIPIINKDYEIKFFDKYAKIPEGYKEVEYKPIGNHALIKAGVEHEIIQLSPDSIFDCVYSHRDAQGEIIQNMLAVSDMEIYS